MILILSKEDLEYSTEEVIDWINALGGKCVRFNGEDLEGRDPFNIKITNKEKLFNFNFENKRIDSSDIKVVWYRRPHGLRKFSYLEELNTNNLGLSIINHLKKELFAASDSLYSILGGAEWVDYPDICKVNKLKQLLKAKTCGLEIPDTLITNSLLQIRQFKSQYQRVITKCISDGTLFNNKNLTFVLYTQELPEDLVSKVKSSLFPTFVQEYIEKEYEIRIFYLNGKCYSMAIFSQNDEKTKIDFRKYNKSKPNRFVPYLLPSIISNKVKIFMQMLNLKTGSIDMIKSVDGRYIFLEVNPVGQFGMVSYPCNYKLEKEIAKYLISKDVSYEGKRY